MHWIGPPGALLSTQGVQSNYGPTCTLMIVIDAELIVVHDGIGHDDPVCRCVCVCVCLGIQTGDL